MREKGRASIEPSQEAAISRLRALVRSARVSEPLMLAQHRKEWPLLWETLDTLLADEG